MCSWEGSATVVGSLFFFFNDTATTEIYTLSLHDALPIWAGAADLDAVEAGLFSERFLLARPVLQALRESPAVLLVDEIDRADRKSTRLNSSHANISYAVFCLKKKPRARLRPRRAGRRRGL